MVGLDSPFSTWESITLLTPDNSASLPKESPRSIRRRFRFSAMISFSSMALLLSAKSFSFLLYAKTSLHATKKGFSPEKSGFLLAFGLSWGYNV